MYKGITLLETLIVLFILSLTLAFALPKWQKNDPKYFLEKEQQRLYFFLRNIQARAENSSSIWFILANRDTAVAVREFWETQPLKVRIRKNPSFPILSEF